ncbi:MAG TPA: KH domain-containing protein, partial [Candidatus Lustribacter sp.]
HPADVIVAVVDGARGPIIELEVNPEDFGKVIGKGGRVAQALRTIVRASAEGKVTIDIVDVEDDDVHEADLEHAGDASASEVVDAVAVPDADADVQPGVEAATPKKKASAAKKPAAKKKRATATAAPKRKKKS